MEGLPIVVAGHICLDLTPTFPEATPRPLSEILVPGSLNTVGECVVSTGGPVANTGLALVRMGEQPLLVACVGDDRFGGMVADIVAAHADASGIIRVPAQATAYSVVLAPPGVDRVFFHNPGANRTFGAEDVSTDLLRRAGIFHLGYPPVLRRLCEDGGRELVEVFKRAREAGATTSLDMTMPDPEGPSGKVDWPHVLEAVLPHVDLFLPSVEEVLYCLERESFMAKRARAAKAGEAVLELLEPGDFSRLAERVIDYGAGLTLLKAGPRGIYMCTAGQERLGAFGRVRPGAGDWADRELWAPAYRAERVASGTGAGDCAIAGFLLAFRHGQPPERTLQCASAAGAQNVTEHDAFSGVRPYEETTRQLDEQPVLPLELGAAGWGYDAQTSVWRGPADTSKSL